MILFSPNMDKLSEKEINTILFFFFFLMQKAKSSISVMDWENYLFRRGLQELNGLASEHSILSG